MKTIFDIGRAGRGAWAQHPPMADEPPLEGPQGSSARSAAPAAGAAADQRQTASEPGLAGLPAEALREAAPRLPEVSELQAVRHYTNLSARNAAIDNRFYPLGSCTMKYNPRGAHRAASLPGFLERHPLRPERASQGFLGCLFQLQEMLKEATGAEAVSLAPMAGAQGEFAGVAMIRAHHHALGEGQRTEILVPEAAHGTNPATAAMCGCQVREIALEASGDVDLEALKAALGPRTAGLMMTNPSTCGLFERRMEEIARLVHAAGGLLYYDGANLNAILGKAKPMNMGFDVLHLNLHKTFATPHGGGGPGAGPVGASERLAPYLPTPMAGRRDGRYCWLTEAALPNSIGQLSAFAGNAGVLLRALAYALMLGRDGMERVGEFATLNANYLAKRLRDAGFDLAYPNRRASHEFVLSLARPAKALGVNAMDFAKRLLDYGIHAPTTYFPLLVPECFLIEPTETETKEELDRFVAAMTSILKEAEQDPERVRDAPWNLPVRRLDEAKAARSLQLVWTPQPAEEPLIKRLG